jgi:hypothetical protein
MAILEQKKIIHNTLAQVQDDPEELTTVSEALAQIEEAIGKYHCEVLGVSFDYAKQPATGLAASSGSNNPNLSKSAASPLEQKSLLQQRHPHRQPDHLIERRHASMRRRPIRFSGGTMML